MKTYEIKFQKGAMLPVTSPFIIAVHHVDLYPKANHNYAPSYYLENTHFGSDLSNDRPFRMYHGEVVPGFPRHPHRGFETITIVLDGTIDHADSLGSKGRYSKGDVQWMTAGKGIQHAEMFPLLNKESENRLELVQVWLNLPRAKKFSEPYYQMLWKEDIPVLTSVNEDNKKAMIKLIHGKCHDVEHLNANPDSWAKDPKNHVKILLMDLEEGATLKLPASKPNVFRLLTHFDGQDITIEGDRYKERYSYELKDQADIYIKSNKGTNKFLLLEGMPIEESVYAYGPFVMTNQQEIFDAYNDFEKTEFGGWPFEMDDPIHNNQERFATYPDKRKEVPGKKDA